MLHSIREVCELTGKSRSSIYRMFSRGDLAYMVGKDGKRRVETSELLRVFDEINFNDSPTLAEPMEVPAAAVAPSPGGDPYVTARELTDLRGMIHDLREELDDLREDNRRLLRLLEYQTTHPPAAPPVQPQPAPSVAPVPQAASPVAEEDPDEEEPVPVTSVADQGWKAYRKQRAEQQDRIAEEVVQQQAQPDETSQPSGAMGELGNWLKNFFFGEWQKRP